MSISGKRRSRMGKNTPSEPSVTPKPDLQAELNGEAQQNGETGQQEEDEITPPEPTTVCLVSAPLF